MFQTTQDYCIVHGHQDFIDFDHMIHCPECFPELKEEQEQLKAEAMQRLVFSLPGSGL